jgi:hypothetical protein
VCACVSYLCQRRPVVQVLRLTKQHVEPLRWRLVRLWLPVNLIFVAMIATSFMALKLVGVGETALIVSFKAVTVGEKGARLWRALWQA